MAVCSLSVEYPFYNPTKNCVHKQRWIPGWEKCSVSISLTPALCPNIVPHSNLFSLCTCFAQLDKSLFLPLHRNEANLLQSAAQWSPPLPPKDHSEPKVAQLSHDNSCSCTSGSYIQHMDKHTIFEWTTRWVENWLACQDRRVVISSSNSKCCCSGINSRANTV